MKQISNFTERFKEAFGNRSVTEFAAEIGVSKQTVSAYLNGVRKPKSIVSAEIARKLQVNPAWLLGFDVSKEITDTNIKIHTSSDAIELITMFESLNDEGKRKLLAYASDLAEMTKYKKESKTKYAYRVAHTKEGKEPSSGQIIEISDEVLEKLRNAPESDIE